MAPADSTTCESLGTTSFSCRRSPPPGGVPGVKQLPTGILTVPSAFLMKPHLEKGCYRDGMEGTGLEQGALGGRENACEDVIRLPGAAELELDFDALLVQQYDFGLFVWGMGHGSHAHVSGPGGLYLFLPFLPSRSFPVTILFKSKINGSN